MASFGVRALVIVLSLGAAPGCVVTYGSPESVTPRAAEPLPPPVNFDEIVERIDALLAEPTSVDQRDRLLVAVSLARKVRSADSSTQRVVLAYLQRVVEVEERSRPIAAPVLASPPAVVDLGPLQSPEVHEVPLEEAAPMAESTGLDPASADPGSPGPASTEPEMVEAAALDGSVPVPDPPQATSPAPQSPEPSAEGLAAVNAAMARGDLAAAVAVAEACRAEDCWQDVAPLWPELRDAFVHAEREAAGSHFVAVRGEADPVARGRVLRAVRQRLADLLDRYPESVYADDLRRNVELVQSAVERAAEEAKAGSDAASRAEAAPAADPEPVVDTAPAVGAPPAEAAGDDALPSGG
jgi:hypothetical protein